jgi:hypothetical protein
LGLQAVLNLCENRLCLYPLAGITKKIGRGSAPEKKLFGASSLDPHLIPPPRHGEEVRNSVANNARSCLLTKVIDRSQKKALPEIVRPRSRTHFAQDEENAKSLLR